MSSQTFNNLEAEGSDVLWFCPKQNCVKPNFSFHPFSPPLITSDNNTYSILSSLSCGSEPYDPGSINTPQISRTTRTQSSSSSISLQTPSSIGDPQSTSTPTREDLVPHQQSRRKIRPCNNNQRKLVLMNCQSVCNKKTELETLLLSVKPDIVIATESWLKPDIGSPEIFPSNYNVYRKDRVDQDGGGVFILVSSHLISCALDEYSSDLEAVWVEVKEEKGPNIVIGAYYRPPRPDPNSLEEFGNLNRVSRTTNGTVIIGGDFNLPGIDWATLSTKPRAYTPALCNCLIDIITDNGLEQIVQEPTRGENLLDLILTNNPTLINNAQSMPPLSNTADHNTVYMDIHVKPRPSRQPPRKVLKYTKAAWPEIKSEVRQLSEDILREADCKSTQEMWNRIESRLQEIINTHIPTKRIKGYKDPPWWSHELKQLFQKRNAAYRKWIKSKLFQDELAFQELKTKAQKTWRQAKNDYANSLFEHPEDEYTPCHKQPLKKFWGYIKSLKKDASGVAPLKQDGVLVSDAKGKSNILNKQYASVFTEEDTTSVPDLGHSRHPKMQVPSINIKGVQKLLTNLNPSKAAGPDQLHPRFLKEVAEELSPLYTALFQKSLEEGYVPMQWRTANVTPVFKKGEKYDPANYRPVSLTAITSKIMEHIIASKIMDHLEQNDLLCDCQHGFRPKRSCESQLLNFTQELFSGLADGQQFDVNIMDFSKAFDRVPHHRLLNKIKYYGIEGNVLSWLSSFLAMRSQRVLVDGETSDFCKVVSGVPQGTVLGPVLFLVFINDLPSTINSPCRLFADDLVVYREVKCSEDEEAMQQDLNKLSEWEDTWGMKFHPDKCEHIVITRKRKPYTSSYTLRGHLLKTVSQAKYLGVTISSKLEWKDHVEKMSKKANKTLGFLRRNLRNAPEETREIAYKTLVRPQLEYCSSVWDPYTSDQVDKIEMIQRRAARFVLRRYHQTSSVGSMLQQLRWESLQERRAKCRIIIFYKSIYNMIAVNSSTYLLPSHSSTRHNHSLTYRQISTTTNYHQYSFYPRTIVQWNALPASVAEMKTLDQFKAGLARHAITA